MNRLKLIVVSFVAALSSIGSSRSSAAAPPSGTATQYGVEIIIFRAASVGAAEDWSAVPAGRGFGTTASRGGATPTILKLLGSSDYHMNNIEGGLRSSGAWHPIAHAAWIQTAANWGTHTGFALSDLGITVPGLSGTVYLERAPVYIHLGFDLQYQNGGATYAIKEMRSVKYNDKQYFDHPAFGIIAQVTPIRHDAPAN